MARQHRSDPDGGIHHVMNRGVDRADIFTDDADRRWFVRLLGEACVAAGVRVVAYCLVRNHFHLVLRCPNGGLSEAMWRLTAEYARVFNHRHERTDSLFGGRFKSKLVESDEYLVHLLRYVHRNPLDIGQRPDAWPWSSYPIYLGQGRAPEWMSVGDALVATGGSAAHRAHVESQLPADKRVFAAAEPADVFDTWRVDDIASSVQHVVRLVHRHGAELSDAQQRDAVVLVALDRELRPSDLVDALGMPTAAAVRTCASRARARVSTDVSLADVVAAVNRAA